MLDLQRLRYFVAVAESQNVGRAAAQLHISQSPLSRQIQQLEDELGAALFTRFKRRLQLTATGGYLLAEAKTLLAHAATVEKRARDRAAGDTGTLRVGFVEGVVHAGLLQPALRRFRSRAPEAKIELRSLRSKPQLVALLEGDLDVGFAYAAAEGEPRLTSTLLLEEPFMLAVAQGHPLAHSRFRPRVLDGKAFIALPEAVSPLARATLLAACKELGFCPDICVEVAEPSVVLDLVEAGVGVAIVQASMRSRAPQGVVLRPLPAVFPLRLRIYRVTASTPRPLVAHFV